MFFHKYLQRWVRKICDFGCGDGWYLHYFRNRLRKKTFWGVDLSPEMIEKARQRNPDVVLQQVSSIGINFKERFDLVYCFAVLAHVSDENAIALLENISAHLTPGKLFLLFEQTEGKLKRGRNYYRRPCIDYERWASRAGLRLDHKITIAFPLFRIYEKTLLSALRLLYPGRTIHEKCMRSNRSMIVNRFSEFFINRSGSGLDKTHIANGNTLFVFSA